MQNLINKSQQLALIAFHLLNLCSIFLVTYLFGVQSAGHSSSMSTTEKQWKVIVDLLQCMTAGQFKTPAASDALIEAMNLLEPMTSQPIPPAKAWIKLVCVLKVGSS